MVDAPPVRRSDSCQTVATLVVVAIIAVLVGLLLRRLGTPLLGLLRQAVRSPRRFAVFVLAGAVAGTGLGFGGPLIGAVLGGLAGSVIAFIDSPPA